MNRRATVRRTKAELVQARVGEVIGALCGLLLLPLLPYLAVLWVVSRLTGDREASPSAA